MSEALTPYWLAPIPPIRKPFRSRNDDLVTDYYSPCIPDSFKNLPPKNEKDKYLDEKLYGVTQFQMDQVAKEGILLPITINNGRLIDGFIRYHIACEHGIKCPAIIDGALKQILPKNWSVSESILSIQYD